ncbi:MAG: hypothetical protein ACE5KF_03590 [Kiloniellaceae bacterium]
MTLGLHEHRRGRRRRTRWTAFKWTVVSSAVVAAGVFAYETGTTLAQREVAELGREIDELSARIDALEKQNTGLRAKVILAEQRLGEARARYRKDVPSGRLAALLGQIQRKLDAGVEPGRLEFLISAAENPRTCDDAPVTKRFMVRTPLYDGANDSVSFAKNTITITAEGESARDSQGNVEAWFDPARPVTLRFTRLGGKTTEKTGMLPLHASVVIGESEFRYSVIAGPRGFVQVTGDRCGYP